MDRDARTPPPPLTIGDIIGFALLAVVAAVVLVAVFGVVRAVWQAGGVVVFVAVCVWAYAWLER
jgi:hypothetical protein